MGRQTHVTLRHTGGLRGRPAAMPLLSTITHLVILANLIQIKQYTILTSLYTIYRTTITGQEAFGRISWICNFPFIYLGERQATPAKPSMVYLQHQEQPQNYWMISFDIYTVPPKSRSSRQGKQPNFESLHKLTVSQWLFFSSQYALHVQKTWQREVNEWENTQTDARKCEQRSLHIIDLLSVSQPNNGRALTRHRHPLPLWFLTGTLTNFEIFWDVKNWMSVHDWAGGGGCGSYAESENTWGAHAPWYKREGGASMMSLIISRTHSTTLGSQIPPAYHKQPALMWQLAHFKYVNPAHFANQCCHIRRCEIWNC